MPNEGTNLHHILAAIRMRLEATAKERRLLLLIVEDSNEDAQLLLEVLKLFRCNPILTSGQNEAIAYLSVANPDLIFLDLKLSDGDGVGLLDWLRLNRPRLPVIVLTGLDSKSPQLQEAVNLGACIFPKPLTEEHARLILGTL